MEDSERLTTRNESGGISVKDTLAALAKLAELEDAEEQGRLARLPPCKVGDILWSFDNEHVYSVTISEIQIYIDGDGVFARLVTVVNDQQEAFEWFRPVDIGRIAFLTYDEAKTKFRAWSASK